MNDVKGCHGLTKYLATFLALFLAISLGDAAHAESGDDAVCPHAEKETDRFGDQVWLVSCRDLGCLKFEGSLDVDQLTEGLSVWRFETATKKWDRSDYGDLWKGQVPLQTVVWVHGNLMTSSEAFSAGLTVYRQLVRGEKNQPPIRFVIWSWPASKILTRPVPDARIKAARTTTAGFRLAGLLRSVPDESSVSLIGFSFGARVVSAALELLAGGTLNQTVLTPSTQPRRDSYRVTLFAAALNSYWLLPEQRFGQSLSVVGNLTLINNYCDRVLKHYGKLYCHCGKRGPSALGYTGLATGRLSAEQKKRIDQFNASGSVGKQHSWRLYIESPTTMDLIRKGTLDDVWEEYSDLSQQALMSAQ